MPMSAHIFDPHSSNCPICGRANTAKPHRVLTGLLTCHRCREQLVITWSGHYVRDPFNLHDRPDSEKLRRESHPLARIRRDFRLTGHSVVFTILGGTVFLGVVLTLVQSPLRLLMPAPPIVGVEAPKLEKRNVQ